MISATQKGSFKNLESFLRAMTKQREIYRSLDAIARAGVNALANATPKDSGLAAASWGYEIEIDGTSCSISWTNTNLENGFPVAVMIQYGHGTGTGGYVSGIDYINPALRPIFDKIADQVWKAVTSA